MSDSSISTPTIQPHVLVFDSGVGGLSVLREISAALPHVRLSYAADNAAFPYGLKTDIELVARVSLVVRHLVGQTAPDLLVIACNTASTTALDAVRGFLTIPVIGVVPAIKPAAAASASRTIGLLGTKTTVASSYTADLIARFADGCRVLICGATELVEAAERKLQGLPVEPGEIALVLGRLFDQPGGSSLDTIVLGCTHFPLLVPELSAAAPHPVTWMDSGAAIARRVASLLPQGDLTNSGVPIEHCAYFTAETASVERMRGSLQDFGLSRIAFLSGPNGCAF